MIIRFTTVICLIICHLFSVSYAVDHLNFKSCEQAAFCKRNRALAPEADKWVVLPDTLQQTGDVNGVEVKLKNEETQVELNLVLRSLLDDGSVLRMHINEIASDRVRFEASDLTLLPHIPAWKINIIKNSADELVLGYGQNNKFIVKIAVKPFRINVLNGDDLLITGNSRGLFNFEHYRKKPEVDVPNDGQWEEQFKNFNDKKPFGPMSVGMDFDFNGFDEVYGIPEHADSFALKDTKNNHRDPYRLYNLDVFEYEINSTMALYGSVPMMLAHSAKRTVGLLWLNPSETWVDVETSSGGLFSGLSSQSAVTKRTHWISETGVVDVFIMMGPAPLSVMKQNALLVGTTPMPPYYSIGHHQCRWNYYTQSEVMEVDNKFDLYQIPYDAIWLDIEYTDGRLKKYFTWDRIAFPNHVEMIANLTAKGRRLIAIIDPHLKKDHGYPVYNEAVQNHYMVKTADDQDYEGWCWPGSSMWPDYLNPNVREWWARKFDPEFFPGEAGSVVDIWNDMNEPSVFSGPEITMPKDLKHVNGFEHRDVHNMYGYLMTMSTHDGLVKYRNSQRPFILTRSYWVGSQRYCAAWTGDNMSKWTHLQMAVPMILSSSVVGMSFIGADVPGFFFNPESEEMVIRWYQAAAFQPFYRAHAHVETRRREPWEFEPETRQLIADAIVTRYSYLPYMYTLFRENEVTGAPVMRPLWFHYPKDANTFALDGSFMLGSAMLVQPIVHAGIDSVDVYLPGESESWLQLGQHSSSLLSGGNTYTIPVTIDTIPHFQRARSIVPKKERARRSAALSLNDPIVLDIVLDSSNSAVGSIYIDDGASFKYKDGEFINGTFKYDAGHIDYNFNGQYNTKVWLERVRFYNYRKRPQAIETIVNEKRETLEYEYNEGTRILVIRKPKLNLSNNWQIKIKH